jgi:hypothetical protein
MCFEPLPGWRYVQVTDRRPTQACAHGMKDLVDLHVPQAPVLSGVLDHLHTPTPAALSATCPPAEAGCLARRWDVHDPPKPGRWRQMAAIECAVVSTQCVDRRLGDQASVRPVITAWARGRQAARATVDGHVSTRKARRQRTRLYP